MFKVFKSRIFCVKVPNRMFCEYFYKITFVGLDKFWSNEQMKNYLDKVNEVKFLKINKSTNKNFCYAELSSHLPKKELKNKMEGLKISGKNVKVRIKELDEEKIENILTKSINFEFLNLKQENIKEKILDYINLFYQKNILNNPIYLKDVQGQLNSDQNIELHGYDRRLFLFEYVINRSNKTKKKLGDTIIKEPDPLIPVKGYNAYQVDYKEKEQKIKLILEKFKNFILNVDYTSYDLDKNVGTFRTLQIKEFSNIFLVTLMISNAEITKSDIVLIEEAVKYEMEQLAKSNFYNISAYLAINNKVKATTQNSQYFFPIFVKYRKGIELKHNGHIFNILPYVSEDLFFLNEICLTYLFNKTVFKTVYDLTSINLPFTLFIKDMEFEKCYFNDSKLGSVLDQPFSVFNKQTIAENELKAFKSEQVKNLDFEFMEKKMGEFEQSLCVLNLQSGSFKNWKLITEAKYQILISNSLSQILDFLKNYKLKNLSFKITKLFVFKNIEYEIKDIIMSLEVNVIDN